MALQVGAPQEGCLGDNKKTAAFLGGEEGDFLGGRKFWNLFTLQEANISPHWKSKIMFKSAFGWDMLIPRRVPNFLMHGWIVFVSFNQKRKPGW